MHDNSFEPRRLFTVDRANAMLPLVRAITRDLANLARDVVERRERLAFLKSSRPKERNDVYGQELAQVADDLELDIQRLAQYVEELRELGVEPKGAVEGLIDFPAMMDGRVVFLCWKLGEPEVLHWHDIDAGFAGRQSLVAGVAEGTSTDESQSL